MLGLGERCQGALPPAVTLVLLHEVLQWEPGASEAWRVAAEAAARREAQRLAASQLHVRVRGLLKGFQQGDVGPFLVDLVRGRRLISLDLLAACTTPTLRQKYLANQGYTAVTLPYWELRSMVSAPEDLRAFIQLRFEENRRRNRVLGNKKALRQERRRPHR